MCHCSTSEDVELGLMRLALCLPCLNGIPNGNGADEQGGAWLVNNDNQNQVVNPSALGDSLGICGLYARAWTRLEMAIYGQEIEDSQEITFCYRDAATFGLCLPFYAFTIGSLQYAVRSYFGLIGSRRQDFSDACCFPRDTILRNEQEIMLHQGIRGPQEAKPYKQYICYDQMRYPPKTEQPAVRGEQAQATSADNRVADTNVGVKATPAGVHSIHEDVQQQPLKGNRRAPHGLEDDATTPAKAKRQEHTLHEDSESATPAKPVPHELGATALRTGPL